MKVNLNLTIIKTHQQFVYIRYSFNTVEPLIYGKEKCWNETTSKKNLFQSPFSFPKVPDMCVTTKRENRSDMQEEEF